MRRKLSFPAKIAFAALAIFLTDAMAADWPQWQGPNRDGVSAETDWSAENLKVLWSVALPSGRPGKKNHVGHSSMAIVGGRVFTIAGDRVICLEAETGKEHWSTPFDFSNCTPTVVGGKVYIYSEEGLLACLDATGGKDVWRKDMREDFEAYKKGQYGYAASPLVIEDLVIVSGRIDGGALLAFDRQSGELKWRANHKGHRSYGLWSSPVLADIDGVRTIVWLPGPSLVGIAPNDGKTLWKYDIPPENGKSGCAATNPLVFGNRIVAQFHPPHARGHSFCIEIRGGKPQLDWLSRDLVPWYFSCAALDGHLYGTDQGPGKSADGIGRVQCYDIATGRRKWSTNGPGAKAPFIIVGGRMISWGRTLAIAKIGPGGHELLAEHTPEAKGRKQSGKWAHPAFCDGRLYLRSMRDVLLCLDVRGAKTSGSP